jgi:hypothetical protein
MNRVRKRRAGYYLRQRDSWYNWSTPDTARPTGGRRFRARRTASLILFSPYFSPHPRQEEDTGAGGPCTSQDTLPLPSFGVLFLRHGL